MSEDQIPVVFTGPSLSHDHARKLLTCRCLPPAQRGDVERMVAEGARCVVVIDGEMIYNAPPSPHEIRDVMRQGVTVYGAASLGALRAVELFDQGMHGLGWVYGAFLSRRVDSDDELLSLMEPETFVNLTVPLINVRFGLGRLVQSNALNRNDAEQLVAAFRSLHFEQRTGARLTEIAADVVGKVGRELADACSGRYNVKRLDAMACLSLVASQVLSREGVAA